jgi:predicted adenine nucleotide alpha hydrolase (AANH) superfamily ATPase
MASMMGFGDFYRNVGFRKQKNIKKSLSISQISGWFRQDMCGVTAFASALEMSFSIDREWMEHMNVSVQ